MAKLIAVLVVALAAIVAVTSAHSTIITTTTIEEENQVSGQQCSRQIQGQRFNQCQRYLQQSLNEYEEEENQKGPSKGGLGQSCCQELRNVDRQCQCAALRESLWRAQRQLGGKFGAQQSRQMMQKAQNLPNRCNLQTRQCQMGTVSITTITEENTHLTQQCQNIRGRRFNQCQNYIQRQITGSSGTQMISIYGQQGIQQCCNELENVERDCQCDAMQEVYRQAQQQLPQWSQQGQGGSRGGQPQTQDLQQIFQNLRDQCNLQAQQCRIPSSMF